MNILLVAMLLAADPGPIVGPLDAAERHFNQPALGCKAQTQRQTNEVLIACKSKKQYEDLKANMPDRNRFAFAGYGAYEEDGVKWIAKSARLL